MPSYAEWVSTGALTLALGSLGWQVHLARAARPRPVISSHVQMSFFPGRTELKYAFALTVVNTGNGATTITEVAWERESEPDGHYSISRAPSPYVGSGPSLPHRIEGNDHAEWVVTEKFMGRFRLRERVRPYVRYVGSPSRLRRASVSRTGVGTLLGGWMELPEFEAPHRLPPISTKEQTLSESVAEPEADSPQSQPDDEAS